jgi:hypothetical protein
LLLFNPSAEEVHCQVAKWFWDQGVFDWFADHLHLIPDLSMRDYIRASELKQSGIDWVKVLLADAVPEKALLVAKIKGDDRYTEERERVRAFQELGGGGQTTWYKWAKRIRAAAEGAPLRIPLTNDSHPLQPRKAA